MIIKPYVRDIADNIGLSILNEVKKMNINTLIVSCPFCLFHLLDVKKKYGIDVNVLDICEFVKSYLR